MGYTNPCYARISLSVIFIVPCTLGSLLSATLEVLYRSHNCDAGFYFEETNVTSSGVAARSMIFLGT